MGLCFLSVREMAELLALGAVAGTIAYLSAQAATTPVATQQTRPDTFAEPINVTSWRAATGPSQNPRQQYSTSELAEASFSSSVPPAQRLALLAQQAQAAITNGQEQNRLHYLNAGDPSVIGPNESRTVIISNPAETNSRVYQLQRNVGTSTGAYLAKGPIPGNQMGFYQLPVMR